MALARIGKDKKNKLLAKLVTENIAPCAFCERALDDEITYGKLYAIGAIQCHYFCVLLSCCLVQKGKDEEGLLGFLYTDILAEIERSKKHKCSYCGKGGATLGCSISQCRKQFHLPCGRERNAVSLFYGNYKSFCQQHLPKQKIPDAIMAKAKQRISEARKKSMKCPKNQVEVKPANDDIETSAAEADIVCVICYEPVCGFPRADTFWPPCCARDAWFHRNCVQRMALSAGMHYLKCPLCNDKEQFFDAVITQGFYVPDRDAAWELEQNAFAEIYSRPLACVIDECKCPVGRNHDSETGLWDIKLCLLCGSSGAHAACASETPHVCVSCRPAAPSDVHSLAKLIDNVIAQEEAASRSQPRGPVMPSRMSLRRTKQRIAYNAASSSTSTHNRQAEVSTPLTNTAAARRELNLKTPRKPTKDNIEPAVLKDIENTLLSPMKMLEQSLKEKIATLNIKENIVFNESDVVEKMKERFKKPKPLSEKKKIINDILDSLFRDVCNEKPKCKEPVKEWCSPKKTAGCDIQNDYVEITEENQHEDKIEQAKDHNNIEEANITDKENVDAENIHTNEIVSNNIEIDDESSSSTFQLPSEFVADYNSDDSLPIFETPKPIRTFEIQKDSSLEISENNQVVNIDVLKVEDASDNCDLVKNLNLKMPKKSNKCSFKFSPLDKETLEKSKIDIDVESFKNHYLNEVAGDLKAAKLKDAVVDTSFTEEDGKVKSTVKRKLDIDEEVTKKKKRTDDDNENDKDVIEVIDITQSSPESNKAKKVKSMKSKKKKKKSKRKLDIAIHGSDVMEDGKDGKHLSRKERRLKKKLSKKFRAKVSIRDKNIQVKIKWKDELKEMKRKKSPTTSKGETAKSPNKKLSSPKRGARKSDSENRSPKNTVGINFSEESAKDSKARKDSEKGSPKNSKSSPKDLKKSDSEKKSLMQSVLNYSSETSPTNVIIKPDYKVTPVKRKYVRHDVPRDALKQMSIQSFF